MECEGYKTILVERCQQVLCGDGGGGGGIVGHDCDDRRTGIILTRMNMKRMMTPFGQWHQLIVNIYKLKRLTSIDHYNGCVHYNHCSNGVRSHDQQITSLSYGK
ncbi:hypothetical protein BLOT_009046 [Blomia tropicalis]|nr:hypothetical protein BLOT_009046 [Blomia tropicalis]